MIRRIQRDFLANGIEQLHHPLMLDINGLCVRPVARGISNEPLVLSI